MTDERTSVAGLPGGVPNASRLPDPQARTVYFVISFVDDSVTRIAHLWQWATHSLSSQTVTVSTRTNGATAISTMVNTILARLGSNGVIGGIDITGHGQPAALHQRLTLDVLRNPTAPEVAELEKLRHRWDKGNRGIVLRSCNCAAGADGQLFLALFARVVGARVFAWDQAYEIVPTGVQYVGLPDGTSTMVYDTGRKEVFGPAGFHPTWNPRHPIANMIGNATVAWRVAYNTAHYLVRDWH